MQALKSLFLLMLLAFAGQASAQTARATLTDEFQVRIGIVSTCSTILAEDIDFNNVTPSAGTVGPVTGTVNVYCTAGQDYTVGLSNGLNFVEPTRRMAGQDALNAGRFIPYALASDAGGTAWDDTNTQAGTGTGLITPRSHTVYATATLTGDEVRGSYEDTVTATLTF